MTTLVATILVLVGVNAWADSTPSQDLRLALEACHARRILGEALGQNLNGDLATELGVRCAIAPMPPSPSLAVMR